jgi:hypothetical protein
VTRKEKFEENKKKRRDKQTDQPVCLTEIWLIWLVFLEKNTAKWLTSLVDNLKRG